MEITKENIDKAIINILTDPKKIQELVDSISSTLMSNEIKNKEELKYKTYYSLDSDLNVYDFSNCIIKKNIEKSDTNYNFSFTSKETAELWAKKLKALNKLRMIKELIDNKKIDIDSNAYILYREDTCYYPTHAYFYPQAYFIIFFSTEQLCERAIELMGKESLDNLFLEIN